MRPDRSGSINGEPASLPARLAPALSTGSFDIEYSALGDESRRLNAADDSDGDDDAPANVRLSVHADSASGSGTGDIEGASEAAAGGDGSAIVVCGRITTRWRLCLLVSIPLLLVLALLAQFVIVPAVLKSLVASSEVEFELIDISNVSADAVTLSAVGYINVHTFLSAGLGALKTTLFFNSTALGTITLPAMIVSGRSRFTVTDRLQIADVAAFQAFLRASIFDTSVQMQLSASVDVSPRLLGSTLVSFIVIRIEPFFCIFARISSFSHISPWYRATSSCPSSRSVPHHIY
jgi:hypothetical protein